MDVTAKQPTVPQAADVAADVTVARDAAGYVAYVRRTAKRYTRAQTLMASCVRHLVYVDTLAFMHALYWRSHVILLGAKLVYPIDFIIVF